MAIQRLTEGDKDAIGFLSRMARTDFTTSDCVAERNRQRNPYWIKVPSTLSGWLKRLKHLEAGGLVKPIAPGAYCYELTEEAKQWAAEPVGGTENHG